MEEKDFREIMAKLDAIEKKLDSVEKKMDLLIVLSRKVEIKRANPENIFTMGRKGI